MSMIMKMSMVAAMASIPDYLAGNGTLGSWEPTNLFAGEAPIVTDSGMASDDIQMYQVIARGQDGKFKPWDGVISADKPETFPVAIAAQAADTGTSVQFYTAGAFNHAALTWPASVATLEARQAAFDRTDIHISHLY